MDLRIDLNISSSFYKTTIFFNIFLVFSKKFQSKPCGLTALVGNKLDGERFILRIVPHCGGVGATQPNLAVFLDRIQVEIVFVLTAPAVLD